MLSRDLIGLPIMPVEVRADADRMRLFAAATGQREPIHFDDAAARRAGYRGIVAPPTFLYALHQIGSGHPFDLFERVGVRLEDTLHGSQSFAYGVPVCEGDTIRFEGTISDVYARRGGALDFLVYATRATNQFGERVADIHSTTIVVVRRA